MSAGCVFFYGIVLLRLRGGGIAPALHEQVDRGYKVRVGDERHHTVILFCIPDCGKKSRPPHSTRELLTRAREWLDTIEDEPDDEDY